MWGLGSQLWEVTRESIRHKGKVVMQIKVPGFYFNKIFQSLSHPSLPRSGKGDPSQRGIYVILLDRKGEGREIISFSSKQSLCQSGRFGGRKFNI